MNKIWASRWLLFPLLVFALQRNNTQIGAIDLEHTVRVETPTQEISSNSV